jgi:hypothetical protein
MRESRGCNLFSQTYSYVDQHSYTCILIGICKGYRIKGIANLEVAVISLNESQLLYDFADNYIHFFNF